MKVEELIAGQVVITARMDQALEDVAGLMERHGITGVPVVDQWGVLAGVVTLSRILEVARHEPPFGASFAVDGEWSPAQHALSDDADWRRIPASEAMVTDLCTVGMDEDIVQAARAMLARRVHRAVVLGRDRNVHGIVSALDFVRLVADGRARVG